jgi:hypothetical protein
MDLALTNGLSDSCKVGSGVNIATCFSNIGVIAGRGAAASG